MRQFTTLLVVLFSVMLIAACAQMPRWPSTATIPPALEMELTPSTSHPVQPPTQISSSAAWIEVDLAKQTVILHESSSVIAEYLASTGVTSDPKYATPPGLYHVQSKEKGPIESVPGVFVSDIIMFDILNGNGIHSRPMDAKGNILDATLGQPATAGCVRVGESARVFEFARLGMWVWIH
jgi:lipoprotein-anchoring transpeptidase ErfK/SrfK